MRKVIERFGTEVVNGIIQHDDRPSTYEAAEKLCGMKLDRRKNYAIHKGEVCVSIRWSSPCTGCSCDGEYPCSCCRERGGGCHECGYTGRVRNGMWTPITPNL